MKARKHRELFMESLETMKDIPATIEAVAEFFDLPVENIRLSLAHGFDYRDGWNSPTWLVLGNDVVYGFINEEVGAGDKS
jgi:hypothetical protein